MERVGLLRKSGRAFQTVGPDTENDREPMDSLTDGTAASLLRYDDRRRQLDLLCMIGVHSSVRYAGARPFRQRWTVTAVQNWIRSGMSNQCSSCLLVYHTLVNVRPIRLKLFRKELLTLFMSALTACLITPLSSLLDSQASENTENNWLTGFLTQQYNRDRAYITYTLLPPFLYFCHAEKFLWNFCIFLTEQKIINPSYLMLSASNRRAKY